MREEDAQRLLRQLPTGSGSATKASSIAVVANAVRISSAHTPQADPRAGGHSRIDVEDDDPFGQSRDQLCHGLMGRMRQVVVSGGTALETDDERPIKSTL